MNSKRKSWQRISSVRQTQCKIAIAAASRALAERERLLNSSARLTELRNHAYTTGGCTSASQLNAQMELGQRLVEANEQVNRALEQASKTLEHAEEKRLSAWVEREAAGKLLNRARKEEEQQQDRKASMLFRHKIKKSRNGL